MSSRSKRPVAHINQDRCDRSPACPVSRICPRDAVVPDAPADERQTGRLRQLFGAAPSHAWKVDESKCSGCLLCAQYCPHRAVESRKRQAVA